MSRAMNWYELATSGVLPFHGKTFRFCYIIGLFLVVFNHEGIHFVDALMGKQGRAILGHAPPSSYCRRLGIALGADLVFPYLHNHVRLSTFVDNHLQP